VKGNPSIPIVRIPDVIERKYSGNHLHPTQKPLCVLSPLVASFSRPGGLVLDPFCRSGSTLLAAKLTGRWFLGIELDDRYFRCAAERLSCRPPLSGPNGFVTVRKPGRTKKNYTAMPAV